jgi:hypothetical protein
LRAVVGGGRIAGKVSRAWAISAGPREKEEKGNMGRAEKKKGRGAAGQKKRKEGTV